MKERSLKNSTAANEDITNEIGLKLWSLNSFITFYDSALSLVTGYDERILGDV